METDWDRQVAETQTSRDSERLGDEACGEEDDREKEKGADRPKQTVGKKIDQQRR